MTQVSREELIAASTDIWVSWLRSALLAFTAQVPVARKVSAFAPLFVDPETSSPAGEIFNQIRVLMIEPSGAPANAAVEVVRSWAPDLDGWRGAAIALQLATRLHGRGLYRATMMLLARSVDLPQRSKQDLAYLSVRAADARFRKSEVEDLSRTLWQLDLLEPNLAAELALIFAREDFGGLENLPGTVVRILPGLTVEPHDGLYAKAIALALIDEFPSNELVRCLATVRQEDNVRAALRAALAQLTVPWAVGFAEDEAPIDEQGAAETQESESELEKRTDVLDELSKVVDMDKYRRRRG
ncbi:MAG: hypothetical protein B7Y45_08020 [Sphingomonas sp. 28-66-16]|nr:MAG: hypothetical protein B7Y45_08020 [Sphingomonas sp. 28-66-16]